MGVVKIKVHEIMYRILSCSEDIELSKAVDMILEKRRSSIMILKDEKPVGIFSERDALRLLASRTNIEKLKIKDVMSKSKYLIYENDSIQEATRMMEVNGVRRLPVIDRDGKAIGLVTVNLISKNMKFMMARGMSSGLSSLSTLINY